MDKMCEHCGTIYEIPTGTIPRTERTADMPPPARVAVWAVPSDRDQPRLPDWSNDPVIHQCRKGKPLAPSDE